MTLVALFQSRMLLPGRSVPGTEAGACVPCADVYTTATAVVVEVELPGTPAAAVRLAVEGGVLVLEGVKGATVPPAGRAGLERFLRVERPDGPFRRALLLPHPVDASGGQARLQDGVLTVVLPRRDHRGAVNAAAPGSEH